MNREKKTHPVGFGIVKLKLVVCIGSERLLLLDMKLFCGVRRGAWMVGGWMRWWPRVRVGTLKRLHVVKRERVTHDGLETATTY